jgi:light-harvesting protein B-800-850 alpha chain
MNQGRIWCVVKPTVGLPLFLGSVTVIALGVHYAVLSNTTWFKGYWQGGAKVKAASTNTGTPVASTANSGFAVSVVPSTDASGATQFVVTVTPNAATADASASAPPQKLAVAPTSGN